MKNEVIEEILVKFITHYDDINIIKIYHKDGWTPIQIAKAHLFGCQSELSKLVLYNVMPSMFKERRLNLKLSMQDVMDKTGVSKSTISRLEKGNDAFFGTVIKLDRFYNDNEC